MSRASFVLLLMIGVLCSMTIAQRRCPRNQEWTCGSACPPPSCDSQPNQPCPLVNLQCVEGCQCKDGLLLNSSGNCVHPSQC